jgi:hypothetical protein
MAVPAAETIVTRDLPPLTADELQHFTWLASSTYALPMLTKPQLARLLDDRARLLAALRNLAEFRPSLREEVDAVLLMVEG